MLQQTRADQARPYFHRFMKRFPSIRALASASRQEVLKAWEGLGYYARARNAHRAAQLLVERYGGCFPSTYEELLALPGVGPYTAAAVGSLAMGIDAAVVDGNVARVLSRVMAYGRDVGSSEGRKRIQSWATALLIPGKAGLSNEALMELGAVCCLPRNPRCGACPIKDVCRGFLEGDPQRYPVKKKKGKVPHKIVGAGVIVDKGGKILIAQRKEDAMLGGLWEFPGGTREKGESISECIARELNEELGITAWVGTALITVHHAYSHFTIDLHARWARIRKGRPRPIHCADFAWMPVTRLRRYPFSKADLQIVQALEEWKGVFPPRPT